MDMPLEGLINSKTRQVREILLQLTPQQRLRVLTNIRICLCCGKDESSHQPKTEVL